MALTRVTKTFAVTDAKIAALLTDPDGGAATYGPSLDVPGVKSVTISGDMETKQLRGDNQLLDSDTILTNVSVSIEHAKFSFDVFGVLLGVDPVETGATPNGTLSLPIKGDSKPGYFKLEAVSASSDIIGGNMGFELPKLIASSFPEMGLAEEDYKTHSWEADALPLRSTGDWIIPTLHETAKVLA